MADLGGVKGDIQPPEPSGPKKKKEVDPEAFREKMKVKKTDPEEKKQQKHKAEAEEEAKAAQTAKKPQQGLGTEFTEPSPYEPAPTAPPEIPPTTEEAPAAPAPPSPIAPPPVSAPSAPQAPEETQEAPPAEKTQQAAPSEQKKKPETKPAEKPAPKAEAKPEKKAVAPHAAPPKQVEESKEAVLKSQTPEKLEEKEKPPAPEQAVEPPPPLPPGAWEAGTQKAEKKDEEVKIAPEMASSLQPDTHPGEAAPTAEEIAPLEATPVFTTTSSPQIMQLFEKIAGVMIVMNESGITETTINLDTPQFANTAFAGTQIVISEFSTAPKEFNIELRGNTQANALFSANAEELVAAFQAGNYNFRVHRVDTSLLEGVDARKKRAAKVQRKKGT